MNDRKFQHRVRSGLIIVLLIVICFGIVFYLQYQAALKDPRNHVSYQNSDEELGIKPEIAKQLKDYRCIAFFGIADDGTTNTMMIAAINWDTHDCKIFKVKSTAFMELNCGQKYDIKGKERSKFACCYTYPNAGLVSTIKMLNRHLDLNIREGVGMDMDAIERVVDDLGGIKVKMDQDVCREFRSAYSNNVKVKNGMAKLNGQQTKQYLNFCNSDYAFERVNAASAFSIFLSILDKAKADEEKKLIDIIYTTYRGVDTNISLKDLIVIAKEKNTYQFHSAANWPYEYNDKYVAGYKLAVPNTLTYNVSRLHREIFGQNNFEPTKTCQRLSNNNK